MTDKKVIRLCGPGDEAALALVGGATFLETFAGILGGKDIISHCAKNHSPELYREWLTDPTCSIWLVEISPGSAPVGYMVVAKPNLPLPDTADDLELKRIYLLGKFQGGGIGKSLVGTAITHASERGARRLLLGVYAHNESAIGFYSRLGFGKLGERQFNVGGKDYDDNMMGLDLSSISSRVTPAAAAAAPSGGA